MEDSVYDHYVAVDWAAENMAIAPMTKKSNKVTVVDIPSDIAELRFYLKNLTGSKILTIEETHRTKRLCGQDSDLRSVSQPSSKRRSEN